MSDADGVGQREVAYRLFAAEYEDADFSYSESDEERAPNYVVTPTGARVNRLFVVGVLTEVDAVSEDVLRGRVVDPTGAFVLYAGQYQPDEQAFLETAETPTFVAVTGKARTFQPEDSQQVFTSVRPESINEVDAATRDRWTVQAAEQTLARVGRMARALSTGLEGEQLRTALVEEGVDAGFADSIALALDHYGTTPAYLDAIREVALDAARVVAGQRDEVTKLDLAPDATGDVTAATLVEATAALDMSPVEADEQAAGSPEQASVASDSSVSATSETASDTAETASGTSGATSSTSETVSGASEPTETESGGIPETTADDASETASESTDVSTTETADVSTTETATETPSEPTSTQEADDSDAGDEFDDSDADEKLGDAGSGEEFDDSDGDLDDFDPGEFDLGDEVREEIEQEYGTEFQSGAEVDEPGAAGIDTSTDAEAVSDDRAAESTSDDRAAESTAVDPSAETTPTDPSDAPGAAEGLGASPAGERPDDLQETVVEVMRELDDGEGADRDELVTEMSQRYGLDADEVEEAIQAALMDGQCYEPDETSLKPI